MPDENSLRSPRWKNNPRPRYWWHRLPGMTFVPPIYSGLTDEEWTVLREWYEDTDVNGSIGECAVPLISLVHGLVMGNRATRIVQLGTCSGYSALLLGFMLRRMNVRRGLFSLDIDAHLCEFSRRWIKRAGLTDFVEIVQLNSTDPTAPSVASKFLGGIPELIIVDSSHEYRATGNELDRWYPALADGGLMVLHDVSRFAATFDVNREGGVRRAFDEWRKKHPEAETFCLNGESTSMDLPRPFYKDACGVGLIHKPCRPSS
jgi:predicted O-methyltransferase YrrM